MAACTRPSLKDPGHAFRLANRTPDVQDSYSIESLRDSIKKTIAVSGNGPDMIFAGRPVSRLDYKRALEDALVHADTIESFNTYVRANFDFYEVYGGPGWGEVLVTGYHAPFMKGSLKKTATFSRPLYRVPPDLVTVDLRGFLEKLAPGDSLKDVKSWPQLWRGRLIAEKRQVVPYYERKEIDSTAGALAGRKLEIAWVDPIDAFFVQIEGSGTVELDGGRRLRVGYANQNGQPYFALGKALTAEIPLEKLSMQRIRAHLEKLPEAQRQDLLNHNPSYVFFQELKGPPLTASGAEVTGDRTIATDANFFPKGTLAFLEIETPEFPDGKAIDPSGWKKSSRWVLDQDTGGAIRGGGRVDLFFGEGREAERYAGVMKRKGRLWYAVPKEEYLQRLQ